MKCLFVPLFEGGLRVEGREKAWNRWTILGTVVECRQERIWEHLCTIWDHWFSLDAQEAKREEVGERAGAGKGWFSHCLQKPHIQLKLKKNIFV